MADPRGRQPIGVNQPSGGGTNYPFTRPSTDIQHLLGDFYLSFPDDICEHPYPFKVAWLYGFGTDSVSPPAGFPSPTHTQDIIIHDDNGVIIFDSTLSSVTFTSYVWNNRLTIFEWVDAEKYTVCRCTQHTAWTQADINDGYDRTYNNYIAPTDGTLDPRTYNKLPQRVRKITVGLTDLYGDIALEEGYNMSLTGASSTTVASQLSLSDIGIDTTSTQKISGQRTTNYLTLTAEPGNGLGTFPACDAPEVVVRGINGAVGNTYGDIGFDAQGCVRYQRPVGLTDNNPRTFEYASSLPIAPQSAIEVRNDCGPCCDCEYFARTYAGLKRQWFFYQDIATDATQTRNTLDENIIRWNAQKICRESKPLAVALQTEPSCQIAHSVIFGNPSKCCLRNVHFRFTVTYLHNGAYMTPLELRAYDCHRTKLLSSPQRNGAAEEITLMGDFPVYEALVDFINPQENGRITFRLCFPDCNTDLKMVGEEPATPDRIQIRTDVYWEDSTSNTEYPEYPLLNSTCSYPSLTVDEYTSGLWTASPLGQPAYEIRYNEETNLATMNKESAYCAACACEPDESESL
jgi:hypothetical protein